MTYEEPRMTNEDFIEMFGCDRDTYDRILCENECRILKERDNAYEEQLQMEKEDVNVLLIAREASYNNAKK